MSFILAALLLIAPAGEAESSAANDIYQAEMTRWGMCLGEGVKRVYSSSKSAEAIVDEAIGVCEDVEAAAMLANRKLAEAHGIAADNPEVLETQAFIKATVREGLIKVVSDMRQVS